MNYTTEEKRKIVSMLHGTPESFDTAMIAYSDYSKQYLEKFEPLVKNSDISIKELLNLTRLSLWKNKLTKLPQSIGNLNSLTRLSLWKNKLTKLPQSIGNLNSLTILDLWDNKLTKLPQSIGNLNNLTWLDLRHNPIPQSEKERIKKALPNCEIYF